MNLTKNKLVLELAIAGVALFCGWLVMYAVFATPYPFYVVASGSMVPALEVNDILVVQGHETIDRVDVGDIIVFNRPDGADVVIVHRIVEILEQDPRILATKGDANSSQIKGTDYPIGEAEYIGKVIYVIPQIGVVTKILAPPTNYILIAIIIGIMAYKHMRESRAPKPDEADAKDLDKVERDPEYADNTEPKDTEHKDTENTNKDKENSKDP